MPWLSAADQSIRHSGVGRMYDGDCICDLRAAMSRTVFLKSDCREHWVPCRSARRRAREVRCPTHGNLWKKWVLDHRCTSLRWYESSEESRHRCRPVGSEVRGYVFGAFDGVWFGIVVSQGWWGDALVLETTLVEGMENSLRLWWDECCNEMLWGHIEFWHNRLNEYCVSGQVMQRLSFTSRTQSHIAEARSCSYLSDWIWFVDHRHVL